MSEKSSWYARVSRWALSLGSLTLLAAVLVPPATGQGLTRNGDDAFAVNRRLGRGVNVLGYDPVWRPAGKARFQAQHFRLLKGAGFDSVRVVLHPFRDGGVGTDPRPGEHWFKTLDWAVEQALANRLLVILDFHEFHAMGEDPHGNRERFLATWELIARRYRNAPPEVLFEILNEPNKQLTPQLWNQFAGEALAVIRRTNPTRTVIVGPASWYSIKELDKLELPEGDRNLIVSVHYYQPFAFTHQGASWANLKDKVGVPWEGTAREREAIGRDFDAAQAWAVRHRRPLFLGEFGAYDKGDLASRVRWTDFVARQAERRGWSWAYWQFDNDFIAYDMRSQQWVAAIRDALIPPHK